LYIRILIFRNLREVAFSTESLLSRVQNNWKKCGLSFFCPDEKFGANILPHAISGAIAFESFAVKL
ncbi:MAG: hypothetical protein JSW07_07590, partial [bacterium]